MLERFLLNILRLIRDWYIFLRFFKENGKMATNGDTPAATADAIEDAIRIKYPEFDKDNAEVWFWQVESIFDTTKVRSDNKKYLMIIGLMPTSVMMKLCDLRSNPPAEGRQYETIKARIIKEFADSKPTKIMKLLENISLGDRKPSQLLAEMKSRSQDTPINDDLLKELWVRNLPEAVQTVLACDDSKNLAVCAEMADRVMEAKKRSELTHGRVNEVQKTTSSNGQGHDEISSLRKEMEKLTKQIKEIRSRSKSRSKSTGRSRSQTPANKEKREYDNCWFHFKFGEKARKCRSPCKFNDNQKN